jgi:hypothetical protein
MHSFEASLFDLFQILPFQSSVFTIGATVSAHDKMTHTRFFQITAVFVLDFRTLQVTIFPVFAFYYYKDWVTICLSLLTPVEPNPSPSRLVL